MFQRILIAWDGSEVALRAFDVAIDLTRRFEGELLAVSIAHSPAHAETEADREESSEAARRYLEATFAEVSDRAERAGVEARQRVIEGEDATQALVDYAHEHGFDLLVCGHHHERRAGRLLLRGVPESLVERSRVPLLIVTEPD
ncbi:MAG: universal stress protein [Actinobacteria bacterium]|nr:universal stress protein [Actinomycetota bacterium]